MKNEIKFGDVTIKILTNSDELTVSELFIPAGVPAQEHHHPHEEVNYVLSGQLEFTLNGKVNTLTTGDCIRIPPDAIHNIKNTGTTDGRVISIWTPSRVDLIDRLGS